MAKRKSAEAAEAAGAEDAELATVQADVAPAASVTARFRLVHLGGEAGSDVRTARLVASAQDGEMVGEINVVLDTPEAIRMFEGGNGLFTVEIKPA